MNDAASWILRQTHFDPSRLHHHETLFTVGNGYLSTRGSLEEGFPGQWNATLIHGLFDDAPIVHTELANAPDWTALTIFLDGERFALTRGDLLAFERTLNLRNALLTRTVRWRSPKGREFTLRFERFASLADPHLLVLRLTVTAHDAPAELQIHAGLHACAENQGLLHWEVLDQDADPERVWLHLRTRHSHIELAMAAALRVASVAGIERQAWDVAHHPTLGLRARLLPEQPLTVEKWVTLYTSRETSSPRAEALRSLPTASWEDVLNAHTAAWQREWEACDIQIEGNVEDQRAVRFNLYHLLIAAPRHDERVSIGAKALSGFGYRGHVFWDTEIFMLPFFTFTRPEIARNLLSYRWHMLPGARRKARRNGLTGAQYPWESADSGDEVTPRWVPSPDQRDLIRIWTGDIQIHVTADIAYALWQYWQVSGDRTFWQERGAEILLDTARFWASRAEWNPERERYEFTDVIGPDEYHEHVDNNAFTNYLARWHLRTALRTLAWLHEHAPQQARALKAKLHLGEEEIARWREVAGRMFCPFTPETRLIEQFQGYFRRRDLDLQSFEPRQQSMQLILGIEQCNQTQVLKQPDVLMLLYLLEDEFDARTIQANYEYYTPRTDHTYGSSLGPAIQAIMACRVGRVDEAYRHFRRAAYVDLDDLRGNTADGIHAASAGGVWQAIVFGFAGLQLTPGGWETRPSLPPSWKSLRFRFLYRGQPQNVFIESNDA
ncbi:MAG: glycoside hydrolase family 65 protein [Anaerolineae bacterium]|nr:MAG: glycoside hydrolase family 65 protein [Anaerolineae bacterium]